MFWYTALSCMIGLLFASVAFGGVQRLVVISFIPIGIALTFADSMPRFFLKKIWFAYIYAITCVTIIIVALKQLPYDPKLDFHLPVLGTYSWTGVAISALYNYIIMMTKLFVVSVWNPKNFVMLKVPLQSTKMMENRANMILVTAEKEKLYKKIGEDGQKLITAIVGSPSDLPWEFLGKTSKSMLLSRFRTDEKNHVTNDSEFKVEFYTKQTLEQAYRSLHDFKEYQVIHEETSNKANVSPALPSMRISYRCIKSPYPGVSDRLACSKLSLLDSIRDMSSHSSKGNRIHPGAIQNKDNKKEEEGNTEKKRKLSLLNPQSQGAKEIDATLSKNAKLEKDFYECFSTPEQRRTFIRSTRFLEKHLVDFANKSTMVPRETLHFSREFLRGVRSYLEDDPVEDATAKEEGDFDESESEKVKEKEKEDDPLEKRNNGRRHSIVEQLAQRETAEIKFTFKRVITSNHEPYEVFTKDTIGKWLIGEKWAKRLLDTTKGLYAIPWFIALIASVVLVVLFLSKSISDTLKLLLIFPFLFSISYSLIVISSMNIILFKKLLQEFMFWYTIVSFIVGTSLASVAFGGTQRLAMISFIPIGITSNNMDSMPRFFVKNIWYGYCCAIVWGILTIIALKQLPYDPKLDFHLPVLGTYSWTGVAISALYNYIIMMTKLFVVSVWNPKNFVMLKVPLQSTKMMENRANMILVTAEKEKMYKKIGEDGQKLITAIVGSPSDVPWEFLGKTSKSMLFSRFRTDEENHVTNDSEFKVEFYTKQTLEQAYRSLHDFEEYEVIHEEKSNKANVSPALPSKLIMYRVIKTSYPGISDRLLCANFQYRCYPDHGFAFAVAQDAEKKYVDQIPKKVREGTVRMTSKEVLSKLESLLYDVSDPRSIDYGNFIDNADIKEMVKVSAHAITSVRKWLKEEFENNKGTTAMYDFTLGVHGDMADLTMRAADAAKLFRTTFYEYKNTAVETVHTIVRAAESYSVPSAVANHVAFVGNLRHFPVIWKLQHDDVTDYQRSEKPDGWKFKLDSDLPKDDDRETADSNWIQDCSKCDSLFSKRVTPGVLSKRYNLGSPPNTTSAKGSIAVAEFTRVYWDQKDLNSFATDCHIHNISIDQHGENKPLNCFIPIIIGPNLCKEALLDIETIKGLSGNIPLSNFYSSEYSLLQWSQNLLALNETELPLVHSISYGNDETQQTSSEYMLAVNVQLQKLGLRGRTVLFASGDNGVFGRSGSIKRFHPGFPATSPFVTSVGGTDFVKQNVIGDETGWWGSGGGFSDIFEIPQYQAGAVATYKNISSSGGTLPDQSKWNNTGRGFPDVSALGGRTNQYCISMGNKITGAYGTSAATPVWAAVIAKLNEIRLANGKASMGWINPFLYQNPDAFYDITTGINSGRNGLKTGFSATKGWDPVTGLGTPNFEKLKALV
eukprot:g2203.t1